MGYTALLTGQQDPRGLKALRRESVESRGSCSRDRFYGFVQGAKKYCDDPFCNIQRVTRWPAVIPLQEGFGQMAWSGPGARVLLHCYDEACYTCFTYAVCSMLFPGLLEVRKMATFSPLLKSQTSARQG